MARERVLIIVKTYPTLSRKYGETVCTAGLREDGSWMRIYPVPFRRPMVLQGRGTNAKAFLFAIRRNWRDSVLSLGRTFSYGI